MSKEVRRRAGTTAEHSTFTGAAAELTIDETKNTVVVHDGSTAGGFPLAKETSLTNKNVIINGNFDIWQRGTSFTAAVEYSADRWTHNLAGGAGTITRQSFTLGQTDVPNEPQYFLRFVKTGSGGPNIDQRIENLRTFAGETVTMSFWARVASGTESVTPRLLNDFGTGGSPSSDTSQVGSAKTITTTWQQFTETFTVNSISGKTLGTSNNHFLGVRFSLPSTAHTFELAQVQLEKGSVATEFERRSLATELQMAQRYYFKTFNDNIASGASQFGEVGFIAEISTQFAGRVAFPIRMRVSPTITIFNIVTGATGSVRAVGANKSVSVGQIGQTGLANLTGSGFTVNRIGLFQLTADAEL